MEIYVIVDGNGRFADFTAKLNRFAKLGYRVISSDLSHCRALLELKIANQQYEVQE